MKNVIKGMTFLFLAVMFAACQQTYDPVSAVSMDKNNIQSSEEAGTGIGTFELTFPDARAADQTGPVTGSIKFEFDDASSVYKYAGQLSSRTREVNSGAFSSTGTFQRAGDYIHLVDNPVISNESGIHSLYLNGDYHYTVRGTQTIIEGETKIGHLKIVLD